MKAEILWVFETVIAHSSLNSNRNKPPLFQTMFPRQWCGKAVSEMKASGCKCLVYNLWHRVACETKTHRRSLCCDLWLIAYHCNADKTNVCNSSFLEWTWRSSDCGISSTLVDNFERKLLVNLTCLTLCRSQWIAGLEIISGESPDTMTGPIHFSSVTYRFWPVKLYKINNS